MATVKLHQPLYRTPWMMNARQLKKKMAVKKAFAPRLGAYPSVGSIRNWKEDDHRCSSQIDSDAGHVSLVQLPSLRANRIGANSMSLLRVETGELDLFRGECQ